MVPMCVDKNLIGTRNEYPATEELEAAVMKFARCVADVWHARRPRRQWVLHHRLERAWQCSAGSGIAGNRRTLAARGVGSIQAAQPGDGRERK